MLTSWQPLLSLWLLLVVLRPLLMLRLLLVLLSVLMLFAAGVLGSRIYGQDDPRDVGLRRFVGQHREADGDVRTRTVQDL